MFIENTITVQLVLCPFLLFLHELLILELSVLIVQTQLTGALIRAARTTPLGLINYLKEEVVTAGRLRSN